MSINKVLWFRPLKIPSNDLELLLSKLPVTRRMLFLIFLVFSLCNTLFLVNYTICP